MTEKKLYKVFKDNYGNNVLSKRTYDQIEEYYFWQEVERYEENKRTEEEVINDYLNRKTEIINSNKCQWECPDCGIIQDHDLSNHVCSDENVKNNWR